MRATLTLFVAAFLATVAAQAAPQRDWNDCRADDPNLRIAGCTRVLADVGESRESRAEAFFNRGYAHAANGDHKSAIEDYSEAIRLNPNNADAYNERGDAWYNDGDTKRAIADYGEAIRIEPQDPVSYNNRGIAYAEAGQYDRAIADYGEAIRLDPDFAPAYAARGDASMETSAYDQAITDYTEAIRLDPENASAYNGRGDAHSEKGEFDLSIADYSEAIRIDPESATAYTNRGLSYQETGDVARAEADFRAALATPQKEGSDTWARSTAQEQLAALTSKPQQSDGLVGERVALVIGNSAYRSVPRLPNPVRDAGIIADALRHVGFSDVKVYDDLSKRGMEEALIDFADRAQGADWALIYYAGHGMEMGGQNYLIPVDAKLEQDRHVQLETVPLDALLEAAGGATKLRLVILDACRNNPFIAQMSRAVASRSIGRGLARVEPSGGTLVAYAARGGQVALDGDGKNSPFATALAEHMSDPGLDVRLMFAKVRDSVLAATDNAQEPFIYGSLPGTTLSFAPAEQ